MRFILTVLCLLTLNAFAYVPGLESLFRNGSNTSTENSTVIGNFVISRKASVTKTEETIKELPSNFSYKLAFYNENKKPTQFLQIGYLGSIFTKKNMSTMDYFPNLSLNSLRLNSEDVEKKFFYSLMASLMNNDGNLMIDFLNSIGLSALKNKENVNRDQIQLISKYIAYLKKLKEDPETEAENPLDPKSDEAREKVDEIMSKPFLSQSPLVKREVENSKLYWVVESEGVLIRFDAQKHRLLSIRIKTDSGQLKADCFNYILFSKLSFPQLVLLRDLEGNEYELEMKDLKLIQENLDGFGKRLSNYRKDFQSSSKKVPIGKPSFTL